MPDKSDPITALLVDWRNGKTGAASRLMDLVYGELHRMAARQMRNEAPGHTLQTTALVHEVYLRICGSELEWQDRAHFFAVAAQQLRRILVDHARQAKCKKRGGASFRFSLLEADGAVSYPDARLLAVDEALDRLEKLDERAAKVVELRFFGGLSEPEAAAALGVSVAALKRDWDFARAWLASQLK